MVKQITLKTFAGLLALAAVISVPFKKVEAKADVQVSAEAFVLMEADSGEIIFQKDFEKRLPMASTTKIMTALVALEMGELTKKVEIAPEAVGTEGSSMYLKEGESLTLSDLLYALMLQSANDAAVAIAYEIAGGTDEFAALMNRRAEQMGLSNTHFTNPHGLDSEEHYTTASDLAEIAREAMKNEEFRKIVSTKSVTLTDGHRSFTNHNKLLSAYDGAIGVKTGYTKRSGRCLVSAASRDDVTLIAVTLNAPSDWEDHKRLLDAGFDMLEHNIVAQPNEIFYDLPVVGGKDSVIRLSNRELFSVTLKKDSHVITRIESDRFFPAPITAGDALARAVFYVDGEEIGSIPLFAEYSVAERDDDPTFFERILNFFGK